MAQNETRSCVGRANPDSTHPLVWDTIFDDADDFQLLVDAPATTWVGIGGYVSVDPCALEGEEFSGVATEFCL